VFCDRVSAGKTRASGRRCGCARSRPVREHHKRAPITIAGGRSLDGSIPPRPTDFYFVRPDTYQPRSACGKKRFIRKPEGRGASFGFYFSRRRGVIRRELDSRRNQARRGGGGRKLRIGKAPPSPGRLLLVVRILAPCNFYRMAEGGKNLRCSDANGPKQFLNRGQPRALGCAPRRLRPIPPARAPPASGLSRRRSRFRFLRGGACRLAPPTPTPTHPPPPPPPPHPPPPSSTSPTVSSPSHGRLDTRPYKGLGVSNRRGHNEVFRGICRRRKGCPKKKKNVPPGG